MFKITLLIFISAVLSSCKGLSQPETKTEKTENPAIGKSIDQLSSRVSIVFQDSQNNYWFANDGVVKYDGKTFIQYTISDGLYANRVRDIQEDHLGNIYFDTGEGINKFDGETIDKLVVSEDTTQARKLKPNDLWFAGNWNMNGTYRYDGKNLYHLRLPKHPQEKEFRELNPNGSYGIYSNYTTFRDKDGNIWFGGSTFGACRFDGNSFLWVSEREMTEIDPGPAMGVRSIVQDLDGNFYFGSNVNSKYRISNFDGVSRYEKLKGIETSKNPEVDNSCISMATDNNRDIWMAHYKGGVWKYDGNEFTHYPVLIQNKEAELFSIYKDRNGSLWLGSHDAGAFKFNGERFVRFQPELNNNY